MKNLSKMNERIRLLRENKDYTQQEVADMLGVGRAVYGLYEKGTRSISVESIIKLSHIYGVSTDFILGLSNNTKAVGSSVESYLNDGAVKAITQMGSSSDKNALYALNALLSDKQYYKLFDSLYNVLHTPMIVPNNINAYSSRDSHEIEAEIEAKAKAHLRTLLGLTEISHDYSDEILDKIISEMGLDSRYISKEIRNIAKMLFLVQIENFIDRYPTRKFIKKTKTDDE